MVVALQAGQSQTPWHRSLQQSALSMVEGKKGFCRVPVIRQAAAQQDSTLLDGAALSSP